MARSGLTKSQVRATRDQLLADGRYPSVDAVRHALGDVGSKSTIHRFLKELRDEEPGSEGGARRADTARSLHALVDQLADRLHGDAEERVRQLRAEHEQALRAKDEELAELRRSVAALGARVQQLEAEAAFAAVPEPSWHGRDDGMAGGFGKFDGLLLNSRSVQRTASPFDLIRTVAR